MASSGQLAQALSATLGLPGSTGIAAIQVLRAADMITKKGRGISAAEMTKDDAATILTALVSGAVMSEIADVTAFLLNMPHVLSFTTGERPPGFEALRIPPSLFYRAAKTSTLREGLTAVLEESWARDAEFDEDGNERYPGYDALIDMDSFGFTVGMDASRSGGFAMIKARVTPHIVMTRFYSTWQVKPSLSTAQETLLVDPWSVFESGAKLMTASRVDGPVFAAAATCLKETGPRGRRRVKRLARQ